MKTIYDISTRRAGTGRPTIVHAVPDAKLATQARALWQRCFQDVHGPFPNGWEICWGRLAGGDSAWARTFYPERRIVIDTEKMQARSAADLDGVLVHEMAHVICRDEVHGGQVHGPQFDHVLARARATLAKPDPPTRPARTEGGTMHGKMTPQAWFQAAEARQKMLERELAAERDSAEPSTSPHERRLHAERRANLERERADAERRERDAIEAYVSATAAAVEFLGMYQKGRARPAHVSLDEAVGAQLAIYFPTRVPLEAICARRERLARERERLFA